LPLRLDVAERLRRLAPFLTVLCLSVLYCLPPLINARGVHSDAAIVGLQAMHMLRGEWSWSLWGAPYQGSMDALLVALGFALTGARPLTLLLVPFAGHLLLTWFTFSILRKRTTPWTAAFAVSPLVFAPFAITAVSMYAPRQWCLTLLFLAFWLLDGASERHAPALRYAQYAGGVAAGVLSLFLDNYSVQFMPGLILFGVACALDGWPPLRVLGQRLGTCAAAFAGAGWLVWYSRRSEVPLPPASGALQRVVRLACEICPQTAAFDTSRPTRNLQLLWNTCLPWLLGYKNFVPGSHLFPDRWEPPGLVHVLQLVGATSLVVGILFGGLAVFWPRIPWPVRRLGGLGFAVAVSSIAGFLVSGMPEDVWSVRYLGAVVWASPFALAPAAFLLGAKRLGLALMPYVATAALSGWLSFGPYVRGPLPTRSDRGTAEDEAAVGVYLRERGIKYATAQYWLAYRLTFLFGEDPIVVPLGKQRYPPYFEEFKNASDIAFIFHPSEPRATPEPFEASLRRSSGRFERVTINGFTVLIYHPRG
jgi:hypothetical protein